MAKIDSIFDFSDQALGELKAWLEPWFLNSGGAAAETLAFGSYLEVLQLTGGLVGYWKLDDALNFSGTFTGGGAFGDALTLEVQADVVADSSGFGNDFGYNRKASTHGPDISLVTGYPGLPGGASPQAFEWLASGGSQAGAMISGSWSGITTAVQSVSFWFKTPASGTPSEIMIGTHGVTPGGINKGWIATLGFAGGSFPGAGPSSTPGNIEIWFAPGDGSGTAPTHTDLVLQGPSVTNNTWYHLAITSDGVTNILYVNGINVDSYTTVGNILDPTYANLRFGLMGYKSGIQVLHYFTSSMILDEVAMWTATVTEAHVQLQAGSDNGVPDLDHAHFLLMPLYQPWNGMVAVTPDGKIIQEGSYSYNPATAPDYKIYRTAAGRLFRSYNPGIHGHTAPGFTGAGPNMQPVTDRPESFRWEWSPASDQAVWSAAQKAFAKIRGTSTAKAGGAAAGGGTAQTGGGATGGAGSGTTTVPFNYDKYLASDPTLAAAQTNVETGRTNLGTQLVGGVEQLYGRLGEMPPNLQQYFSNLPQEVRDRLAASQPDLQAAVTAGNQAGTSALARLQRGYDVGQSADVASLVGRGMIHSGEFGQRLNEDLRGLTLGQYDARQQAADTLGTLQQSYLTGQSDLTDKAASALTDAQTRASNLIGLGQLGPYTTAAQPVTNPYLKPTTPTIGPAAPVTPKPPAVGATIGPAAPSAPKPPRLAAPYASKPML